MSALRHFIQDLLFRFGIRPAALLLVVGCAGLVYSLMGVRRAGFVASAVTQAPSATLASLVDAKVEQVHVAVGDPVRQGQLPATLSSPELEREHDEIEGELQRLARAAEVAELELLRGLNAGQRDALERLGEAQRDARRAEAEAERRTAVATAASAFLGDAEKLAKAGMIEPAAVAERAQKALQESTQQKESGAVVQAESVRVAQLRRELDRMGAPKALVEATAGLYRVERDVLERRRASLQQRLTTLTLRSPLDGVVAEIVRPGSVVTVGVTVVRVVPPYASDVVAFVPVEASLPVFADVMSFSVLLADGRECRGQGHPYSTGEVVRKPEQLVGPGGFGAYGFPVRMPLAGVPCQLPIGQVVELRLGAP